MPAEPTGPLDNVRSAPTGPERGDVAPRMCSDGSANRESADVSAVTELWATTKVTDLMADMASDVVVPEYGTPAWVQLPPGHGLKWASALHAAEAWRREEHERRRLDALAEADPDAWFREVTAEADRRAALLGRALAAMPSHTELEERRRGRRGRAATASPGWSPVAIPGRPGWWRHYVNGAQIDLPHYELPQERRRTA